MDTTIGHTVNSGFVLAVVKQNNQVAVDFMSFLENQPEINKLKADGVVTDPWLSCIANETRNVIHTIVFNEMENGQWRCVPIELNVSQE